VDVKSIRESRFYVIQGDFQNIPDLRTAHVHPATCNLAHSLDMAVLPYTGALCYHNCCIDGGTSAEYFGYLLLRVSFFFSYLPLWFESFGCFFCTKLRDVVGFESRQERDIFLFTDASREAMGPNLPLILWVPRFFTQWESGQNVRLITRHLVSKLGMSGVVPLPPRPRVF
jgi:hypothetical protein